MLQPELELEKLRGSGLSNLTPRLRIRYEIRREFAPFPGTDQLRCNAGLSGDEFLALAGIRAWL